MYINELKIFSNNLESQVDFYTEVLGVKCIQQSNERASLQIGSSVLTIESRPEATPYHFAINIPSNKEIEALAWLKERVDTLENDGVELHDFDFWNAKAMYFYDHDKNIVEFISRKNLEINRSESFDQNQLLSISEIGMPSADIASKFNNLDSITGIQKFSGGFERMLAIGDELGLFICINKEIKDWFPTGDKAHSSDFELDFTEGEVSYRISYKNDTIQQIN